MKGSARWLLPVAGLLACAACLFAARLVATLDLPHFEPGRRRATRLSAADQARLRGFDEEIRLAYYVSPREGLPAHLAQLEERVRDVLGAFERAAGPGQDLRVEVVHPEAHPEWKASFASAGLAPWRARRVEGDGWRDDELWSSLRIGYGPRPAAVFNGLDPARIDRLQELVLTQLEELREPRRPRVALDAPPEFDELRRVLATGADVIELDFDAAAELPPEIDAFFWLDAEVAEGPQLAALESLRARGGSVVFATASRALEERWSGGELELAFPPRGEAARRVQTHFGLTPLDGLLLDPRCGEVAPPGGPGRDAPWRVRSTPDQQDFRTLRGQPNGSLLFHAPQAFVPDRERLAELGLSEVVLAGASELATLLPIPAEPVSARGLLAREGRPEPHAALAVLLRPADPWSGRLLVLADSAPLGDAHAFDEDAAHGAFLRVLLTTLLGGERLVAGRLAAAAPEPLPPLPAGERALWRSLVVLGVPLLLAGTYALRRRRGATARSVRGGARSFPFARVFASALLSGAGVLILARLAPPLDVDLTHDARNRLSPAELEVLAELAPTGTVIELWTSPEERLPAELVPVLRELRRALARLARAAPGLELREGDPASLPDAEREALAREGVGTLTLSTTLAEVQRLHRVHAHLLLRNGERSEVLPLPTPRSLRHWRFRLVHALHRLRSGEASAITLLAEPPRLSPAEATLEYQRRGLFAPREGDAFSALEELLVENDFEVTRADPRRDPIDPGGASVFWLQPRRDLRDGLAQVAAHLHAGGFALVAGQHFRMRSRQLERAGLQQRFWPEPQFLDLELHYLPELGLRLERRPVFQERRGSLPLATRVDRADGPPRYVELETTRSFLARARSAEAGGSPAELLLPAPSRLEWDADELARRGLALRPWVRGLGPHWSFEWTGGDLPEGVLDGSAPEVEHDPESATYAAWIEGPFPRAEVDGEDGLELRDEGSDSPGRLLLVGSSAFLANDLLGHADYDHELLALRAAALAELPAELAAFLDRAPGAPALEPPTEGERLLWRALVLGGFPLLLLLAGALRRRRA